MLRCLLAYYIQILYIKTTSIWKLCCKSIRLTPCFYKLWMFCFTVSFTSSNFSPAALPAAIRVSLASWANDGWVVLRTMSYNCLSNLVARILNLVSICNISVNKNNKQEKKGEEAYQVLNGVLDLGSPDTSKHLVEDVGRSSVTDVDVEVINHHISLEDVEHLEFWGGLQ